MTVKAALLLFREFDGKKQLLFIKTHERDFYIFPGGVQEGHEAFESILQREAKENLNITIKNTDKLGVCHGHTPSGVPLEMYLFTAEPNEEPVAIGEIEKLWWMDRDEALHNAGQLTPIAVDKVFPLLKDAGIW